MRREEIGAEVVVRQRGAVGRARHVIDRQRLLGACREQRGEKERSHLRTTCAGGAFGLRLKSCVKPIESPIDVIHCGPRVASAK